MKYMKFLILTILFSFLFIFSSCKYHSYGLEDFFYRSSTTAKRADELIEIKNAFPDRKSDFESLSGTYKILVVTDVHFGGENMGRNGPRKDKEFIEIVNKMQGDDKPKLCVCLGDVAEHGLEDEFNDYLEQLAEPLEELGIPVYNLLGNHDLYNSGWSSYKKLLYPNTSFYHFNTNGFSYYFLDSASGSLGHIQYVEIEKLMKSDHLPKLVFTHIPIYAEGLFYFTMQNSTERNKLISLFNYNNVLAVIDGHTHKEFTSDLGKFTEYNIAGFLSKRAYAIITVNEDEKTVKCESFYY